MKRFFLIILSSLFVSVISYGQNTIAYWHLDESSGDFVEDVSGFNNHGTADPTATIVTGILGNARMVPQFTSKFGVTVPSSASLDINGNNPFTLEAFIKLSDHEPNGIGLIAKTGNYGLGLGSYSSSGKLQLFIWQDQTNAFILEHQPLVPTGEWIHVAGTWDGTTAKLYINYNLVESQSYTTPIGGGTSPLWLASTGNDIQPTTETIIDEIRITAAALDPSEFLQFPTDVKQNEFMQPNEYVLQQNFPNPFNPSTTIKFQLPELSYVTLKVYDILGREVSSLINDEKSAGIYNVEFNAINLPSGVYLYQLRSKNFTETKKMILLK